MNMKKVEHLSTHDNIDDLKHSLPKKKKKKKKKKDYRL